MIGYLIAIPLIAHGLANLAGVFAPWAKAGNGFSDRPWLFSNGTTLQTTGGHTFSFVWLLSMIMLVGAGMGVVGAQDWWRTVAIVGSLISMFAIVPWWNTVPAGARFGAIFDLVVIVDLLSPFGNQLQ